MPEVHTLVEGDDDRAFLSGLQATGLVEPRVSVGKPSGGKDALPALAAERARIGVPVLVVRDPDDLEPERVRAAFARSLQDLAPTLEDSPPGWILRAGDQIGRIALVLLGVDRGHELAQHFRLESFAMDDHVLLLLWKIAATYGSDLQCEGVGRDLAFKKLDELLALLRGQGVPVRDAKRVLHLFRGICGFRASPATFVDRTVRLAAGSARDELIACTAGVCASLREAVDFLSPPPPPPPPGTSA